jgi:hypothetical protein|tara:strand:- start:267 stop:731 length:465 start_codon:yes stop_codon:yes gene_type:complete
MLLLEYNKLFRFDLTGQIKLGFLSEEQIKKCMMDGRFASHYLEKELANWFVNLTESEDTCGPFDHLMGEQKIDHKNCTKGGVKFLPSHMIGAGREFNEKEFLEKTSEIDYLITDINTFPIVGVMLMKGSELAKSFPKGTIKLTDAKELLYGNRS